MPVILMGYDAENERYHLRLQGTPQNLCIPMGDAQSGKILEILAVLEHRRLRLAGPPDPIMQYAVELDPTEPNLWKELWDLVGQAHEVKKAIPSLDDIQESLGFCNCGSPETSLRYIRDGLRLIARRHDKEPWDEWFAQLEKDRMAVHGNQDAFWFFQYWTDSQGWCEHGSGISSQWLTTEGEQALALLEAAIAAEEEEAVTE